MGRAPAHTTRPGPAAMARNAQCAVCARPTGDNRQATGNKGLRAKGRGGQPVAARFRRPLAAEWDVGLPLDSWSQEWRKMLVSESLLPSALQLPLGGGDDGCHLVRPDFFFVRVWERGECVPFCQERHWEGSDPPTSARTLALIDAGPPQACTFSLPRDLTKEDAERRPGPRPQPAAYSWGAWGRLAHDMRNARAATKLPKEEPLSGRAHDDGCIS